MHNRRVQASSSRKSISSRILRHTFASHYMMRGGNILTLQRILGHGDIKMTMRYSHLAPDHFDGAQSFTLGTTNRCRWVMTLENFYDCRP